ncbi:hypothetical protein IL306_007964 [Fusarium sp. DS 682]|nr:hypothetical protein IL306_007964 [Fusarium sp. DS 682]
MSMAQFYFPSAPKPNPMESSDNSNLMNLSLHQTLQVLDATAGDIPKFYRLGLVTPAKERKHRQNLEASFKQLAKNGNLEALRDFVEPRLLSEGIRILHNANFIQNDLSQGPKEIYDYYMQLIERTKPVSHVDQFPPAAQEPADRIVEYTESYRIRHDSAHNFVKRLRCTCQRIKKFCAKKLTVAGCDFRFKAMLETCREERLLKDGLSYLKKIGTDEKPPKLFSALDALVVAYSLIHQVPGQVKEKELEKKFIRDLSRWEMLIGQGERDLFDLFKEISVAAFKANSFPRASASYVQLDKETPPGITNMYPDNDNVVAQFQSVAFEFFLGSCSSIQAMKEQDPELQMLVDKIEEDDKSHQAPDQNNTLVEVNMDYQMSDANEAHHQASDQNDSGIDTGTPNEGSMGSQVSYRDAPHGQDPDYMMSLGETNEGLGANGGLLAPDQNNAIPGFWDPSANMAYQVSNLNQANAEQFEFMRSVWNIAVAPPDFTGVAMMGGVDWHSFPYEQDFGL